jgi:hypothetical protein
VNEAVGRTYVEAADEWHGESQMESWLFVNSGAAGLLESHRWNSPTTYTAEQVRITVRVFAILRLNEPSNWRSRPSLQAPVAPTGLDKLRRLYGARERPTPKCAFGDETLRIDIPAFVLLGGTAQVTICIHAP